MLVWNVRGAGGRNFHNLVRNTMRIHNIDFVTILEPRISGVKVDAVINRIGLVEGDRVEAIGFSRVWCLWNSRCPPISVIATSRYCIHLLMNANSPSAWHLSIVYSSPNLMLREYIWHELREFNSTFNGPWYLAGDFNVVLSQSERLGGGLVNVRSCISFVDCLNDCNLIDVGFSGSPFTWSRSYMKMILDRVVYNAEWQSLFPNSAIIHLPLPASDHSGLWIKLSSNTRPRSDYSKFIGSWINHHDFNNQVSQS